MFSAITMPEKISIYTTLAGLLNVENYSFGGEFVDGLARKFRDLLNAGSYSQAELVVSFPPFLLLFSRRLRFFPYLFMNFSRFLCLLNCLASRDWGLCEQQPHQLLQPGHVPGNFAGSHLRQKRSTSTRNAFCY